MPSATTWWYNEIKVVTVLKKAVQKTEAAYKRFRRQSKSVLFSLLAILVASLIMFFMAKSDGLYLLFDALILLEAVLILLVSSYTVEKCNRYLQLLAEERNTIVRTGVFKEIYEAYLHDGFAFKLVFDKLPHEEYFNNTIDIGLQKNKREFLIEIDENQISLAMDEESDSSVEAEYQLADFTTVEQVYLAINQFIQMQA